MNTWWKISNAKCQFNRSDRRGNAATRNDGKPEFLRKFADWVTEWQNTKIRNCEKFQLSKQTSDALSLTLRCHANLIEDLLMSPEFSFVLTSRFQSDPIERRFSQYRQMSGGRFLVSWKNVNQSETILKMKTLLKADCNLQESLSTICQEEKKQALVQIDEKISHVDEEVYQLNSSSLEVSNMIAGYVSRKASPLTSECCADKLVGECTNDEYIKLLSRGGLLVPSQNLSDMVATSFAVLDKFEADIRKCKLSTRETAEYILNACVSRTEISCENHEEVIHRKVVRTVVNVFLNNQTKRKAEEVLTDKVRAFKRSKFEKKSR